MVYPLSQEEQSLLRLLLDEAGDTSDYLPVYQYILFHTSSFDQTVSDYTQVTHEILADAEPLAGVNQDSWIWARGAYGVNDPEENNYFSDFIRDYTYEQFQMRYGSSLGDTDNNGLNDLQVASNAIANAFALDILHPDNNGALPSIEQIGEIDAGAIAARIFNKNIIEGETGSYAPWAGTILFPYLGVGTFTREWLLTLDTNAYKKINGTYDLISTASSTQALDNTISALLNTGNILETIEGNSIGEEATKQLLINLREEANVFFQEAYDLPDEGRFQIGGDLPLHHPLSLSSADYLVQSNYILGSLGDDANIVTYNEAQKTLWYNTDIVNAGLGNDVIIGSRGEDLIDGAEGIDTVDYSNIIGDIQVYNQTIIGTLYTERLQVSSSILMSDFNDYLYGIENIIGTNYDDTIYLGSADNRIESGSGNDILRGGVGSDYYVPGIDQDTIEDIEYRYLKNFGDDTLDLNLSAEGIAVDFGGTSTYTGEELSGTFVGIENLILSDANDTLRFTTTSGLIGDHQQYSIDAGDGTDTVEVINSNTSVQDGIIILDSRSVNAKITNAENIIFKNATTTTHISVDDVYGYTYYDVALDNAPTLNGYVYFDYSKLTGSLTVDTRTHTVSNGINTDTFAGKYVGTNVGDTVYSTGGAFILGTGNDHVHIEYLSPPDDVYIYRAMGLAQPPADAWIELQDWWPNGQPLATVGDMTGYYEFVNWSRSNSHTDIYYQGGNDVIYGANYSQLNIMLPEDIRQSDLTFSRFNQGAYYDKGLTINIAGMGSIQVRGIANYDANIKIKLPGEDIQIYPRTYDEVTSNVNSVWPIAPNFYTSDVSGTNGNESLYARVGEDSILNGYAGNDSLRGSFGIDTIMGGQGNDKLYGEYGDDFLYGDEGDDTIYAEFGADTIDGGLGSDTVYAGANDDILIYTLDVSESNIVDTYYGGSGYDELELYITTPAFSAVQANVDALLDLYDTSINPDAFFHTLLFSNSGSELTIADVERINVYKDDVLYRSAGEEKPDDLPGMPEIPVANIALNLSGGLSFGAIADSADVNTGAQDKKTHSMSFATSADVTSTQVLYEQGGATRGLNFVVTGGTLFAAVWNNAEENWGYKELQVDVEANTFYTATLVMDGELPTDGSATLYLNGGAVDTIDGVGRLYSHGDNIGIGQTAEGTLVNGVSTRTAYTFTGSIEKLAHYNAALSGEDLDDLHDYMAYEWLIEEPVNTNPIANDDSFIGDENLDITGNVLGNDGDIDGDAINVSSGTYATAQGGSITLQSNGDFTYTPLAGFFGNDSVSYTLNDARGGTDTATINFVVNEEIISGPELPSEGLAVIEEGGVTFGGRADSSEINLISTLHKTQSVSFETGADITSTQVIYEQGGSVRGLNMFIDGGKVYAAVWNSAEENWGYHELEFDVLPNTKYVATLVMDGALPADGSISFYLNDEAPVTSTGIGNLYGHSGDIGVGMTPDNTRIHDAVTSGANTFTGTIEKWAHYNAALSYADVQQLHDYMGEGWLDQAPIEDIVMEFGSVSTNQNEVIVDLDNSFDNPVVFVTMTTFNGNQVTVARVTDVQSDSFTFYAQEADYLDGAHATESFSYIVAEAGSWVLSDGTKMEIGTHDTNLLHRSGFDTIAYETDFAARPTILTQVQTDNDAAFVSTRFKGANDTSFQLALQEEEISASGSHGSETIGWMAIEQGAGSDDGFDFFAGVTGDSYNDAWKDILFDDHLDVLPQLLANISSNDGSDASFLRADNITTNSVSVSIQEDQSKDEEVLHTTESIDFFAIEGQGKLTGLINGEIV